METMKSLSNLFLAEAETALLRGQTVRVRVAGESMLPFLRGAKDTIELVPVASEELRRGTVVLFRHNGSYVIHRIIACCEDHFVMQGDGNIIGHERAARNDIAGVLRYVKCSSGRTVDCRGWRWRLLSATWMRLRPVRRYLLAVYRRINKEKSI